MSKILIADDHSIIRAGIKKILEKEMDLQVIGEAGNANDVLDFLRKNDLDLLLLDINMPGANGLGLLREVRKLKPPDQNTGTEYISRRKFCSKCI